MRSTTRSGEAGFTLVEVMISAMLVLMLAASVLGAIDNAQKTSASLANQAIASNVAQSDQERLRALRVTLLGNLFSERDVAVKGVNYHVTSTGTFVSDSTQAPGCTSTAAANHIRITSSVQSPAMKTPIELTSLVNPSIGAFSDNTGGIVVKLTGASGAGMPGVDVRIVNTADASKSYTQPTSTDGCAFFAYVPVGQYAISYNETGYVSTDLVQNVSFNGTVTQGTVLSYQKSYDRAFSITAQFATLTGSSSPYTEVASSVETLTVGHSNLPGSQTKTFLASPVPAPTVAATGLYPHATPAWDVYGGSCSLNKLPTTITSALPAGFTTAQLAAPAGAYNVKVFEPALTPSVTVSGSSSKVNARVVFTEGQDPSKGCTGKVTVYTDTAGKLYTDSARTKAIDPGLPYSIWTVCAEAKGTDNVTRAISVANVKNDLIGGRTQAITVPNSGAASTCV